MSGFYDEAADINVYQGLTLWYIPHNGYVAFYNLDFESGADTLQIKCSSEFANSRINIHLDSLNGELIGTCPLINSGRDIIITYSISIHEIDGVHKIYLVFEGSASIFHSIKFKKTDVTYISPTAGTGNQCLVIYPNPAHNTINIAYAPDVYKRILYSLSDMKGTLILHGNTFDNSIDVSGINSGIYLLKLNINGEIIFSNVLIEQN
jgi:hypothetical protein